MTPRAGALKETLAENFQKHNCKSYQHYSYTTSALFHGSIC